MKIAYLDLEITRPVLLVAGLNEQGKTSLAEAIRFAVFGDSPRVKYKKDFEALVTHGAKRGSVEITFDNYTVKRNVKDGKATGDTDQLPTDTVVASMCLGATRFAALPETQRRELLMRLLAVKLTPENVTAELKERGFTDAVIRKYEPIYRNGVGAAFDKADRISKENRGAWREVTGEAYGPEKAEGWKSPTAGVPVAELEQAIADVDAEIAKAQTAQDAELAPVLARIHEMDEQIDKPPGMPCPHCGSVVLYTDGKLVPYEGTTEDQKRVQSQLRTLQHKKRDDIRGRFRAELEAKQSDRAALAAQIREDQSAREREKRAAQLHQEIKDAEVLRGLFGEGPDSIRGRFVAKAIEPFNEAVAALARGLGWQTITVGGDMAIARADQIPYELLSESAQWRADMLLHTAISAFADFAYLVFDRLDVLDPKSRVEFITWADEYDPRRPLTMIVLATLKEKPDTSTLENIQTEWLVDGGVARAA